MWRREKTNGRTALISAALIITSIAAAPHPASARKTTHAQGQNYQIRGELSEEDILALWPPARKHVTATDEASTGRRYYRSYGGQIPLGDWIPDSAISTPGARLRADEQRMKLQKDARDRDGDGVPDSEDVYPWDPTRW
jgi:hypothetical protein